MYMDKHGELQPAGTAFLVLMDDKVFPQPVFFVTAKHVIDGVREVSSDQTIYIRINDSSGRAAKISFSTSEWFSSADPTIDIAILYWPKHKNRDLKLNMTPMKMSATKDVIEQKRIGIGDETFVIGLFVPHFGREVNEPIARIGNIAAFPREPISTEIGEVNAYLIETRSTSGLSGSPVYVHLQTKINENGVTHLCFPYFLLLGAMHGHFDTISNSMSDKNRAVNAGIGIVTPVDAILQVIRESGDRFELLDARAHQKILVQFCRSPSSKPPQLSGIEWEQRVSYLENLGIHSFINHCSANWGESSDEFLGPYLRSEQAKNILEEILDQQ